MSCDNVIELVENDQLPEIVCDFGIDITGYGAITLHIKYPAALGGPITKTASITNAALGQFKFAWAAGDLKRGRWPAEIELINASGKPLTFRDVWLDIAPEIA